MESSDTGLVRETIKPLISAMGYALVEVKLGRTRHLDDITVVIYKPGGVNLQDCADVSRQIKPRLELLDELDNITLKVTSPGVDRVIKDVAEYGIFKGRGVKLLLQDQSEWTGGIIEELSGHTLSLQCQTGMIDIDINYVRKAKLDYTEEVRNR